jgi:hypothetical protein
LQLQHRHWSQVPAVCMSYRPFFEAIQEKEIDRLLSGDLGGHKF